MAALACLCLPIGRLAEEARRPLPESVVPDTGSGGYDRTLLFVGAAAAIGALALAGVATLLILRGRRRSVTP